MTQRGVSSEHQGSSRLSNRQKQDIPED